MIHPALRALFLVFTLALFSPAPTANLAATPIGQGDGRIHVIPTLSSPSIKNGEKLTISAVIKATAGVAKVEARIIPAPVAVSDFTPLATLLLKPAPQNLGGAATGGTLGLWQAEWTGAALAEGYYDIILCITDRTGHTFTDRSLRFSDPIAGNDVIGDTEYPEAGMALAGNIGRETFLTAAVIDAAAGYAYFGTGNTSPAVIVKVALGTGANPPTRVGAVTLNSGENGLHSAVIDPIAGYAYFGTGQSPFVGTNTNPGRVVKIALGSGANPPTRVGAVTLNSGEIDLRSAVIDPAAGYAYFSTYTIPGRVVKVALGSGATPPARVGALTLNSGENYLACAVIDVAAGCAYFGTDTSPGCVVKVALSTGANTPSRVGAVTLPSDEYSLRSAVIDPAAGYAYFGAGTTPGRVVKVALRSGAEAPTRVGAVTLNSGEDYLYSAVINPAAGYACFGTNTSTGIVIKVALGSGANPPTRAGKVMLNSTEGNLNSAVIDVAKGYAWFGANTDYTGTNSIPRPGTVIKVALESGPNPPTRTGAVTLNSGEGYFKCAVVDTAAGYAYFGTDYSLGTVVKVALGNGADPPMRVGSVKLNGPEYPLECAVIDPAAGYAYFGTMSDPGIVVKVALGNGASPPTRVGAVTLNNGETNLYSAVIDPAAGYAYFGTAEFPPNGSSPVPGRVVKVALGTGANPPTRVGAVTLNSDEFYPRSAVIDPAAGYAYFGTLTSPGIVVKVALGAGNNPPTRAGALTLNSNDDYLYSAVIDTAAGYAYFGTGGYPGRIIKVALGSGANPPTRIGTPTLASNENQLKSAVIDTAAGYAYFGTASGIGNRESVVKVALGNGTDSPTRVGSVTFKVGEVDLTCAVIDPAAGYAYFGTLTNPPNVQKVALSHKGQVRLTRFTMPEMGRVQKFSFYSHAAAGHLRLGLYHEETATSRKLVWQSGSISNTVANGYIDIPTTTGTPTQLTLEPGTYHLAWQVDTAAKVSSYILGANGDGAMLPWTFGPFPPTVNTDNGAPALTPTAERYNGYITYEKYSGVPTRLWLAY